MLNTETAGQVITGELLEALGINKIFPGVRNLKKEEQNHGNSRQFKKQQ